MENAFYLRSGKSARNLKELLAGVKAMGNSEYNHHVNSEKNDFSNWVNDVLKKPQLAKKIRQAKTKAELVKLLEFEVVPATKKASTKPTKKVSEPVSTKAKKPTAATKKVSKAVKKPVTNSVNKSSKVDEILKREEKILEIEQMLEEKMAELNRSKKFRIEEFVQGLISGAIIGFVIGLFLVSI